MIELVTGVPGSGKSLYTVSKRLRELLAQTIKDDDGNVITRRLCIDGIPDLVIDHEVMAKTVLTDTGATCEGQGVANWWEWCKPGDVIVIDEVQRIWRPRGMGSKVPRMIAELETHRHKGVDFVLITQSPMLIDQNVRRLVGRHLHVRRLFGGARAAVYEWDGCNNDPTRSKGATISYWPYPKKAYNLYKSAELHTKQKHSIPAWIIIPIAAVIGGAFLVPQAVATLGGAMTGKGITQTIKAPAPSTVASAPKGPASAASAPQIITETETEARPSPERLASLLAPEKPKEKAAGCILVPGRCKCTDSSGRSVPPDDEMCSDLAQPARLSLPSSLDEGEFNKPDITEEDRRLAHEIRGLKGHVPLLINSLPGPAPKAQGVNRSASLTGSTVAQPPQSPSSSVGQFRRSR